MKLLDLMLAHNVQWPEGYDYAAQANVGSNAIYFYSKLKPTRKGVSRWDNPSNIPCYTCSMPELAEDWASAIICKADYIVAQYPRLALKALVRVSPPEHPDVVAFKKWYAETLPVVEAKAAGLGVETDASGAWQDKWNAHFVSSCNYRIKPQPPKTININGYEVPEPLRVEPTLGARLYCVTGTGDVTICRWSGSAYHTRLLRGGMLHLTNEAAKVHSKALASFTQEGD